jgi:hypothetical protein
MNRLSKEKRDKLVLTCIGILGALGALYTFVLGAQKAELSTIQGQTASTRAKLAKAETLNRTANMIQSNLAESRQNIEVREQDMAPPGPPFYWFLKMMDQFRREAGLDSSFIVDISQPEFIDVGLLPKFPYKAASFGLRISGGFQEIGRFIADIENEYPFFRVQNIKMSPVGIGMANSTSPSESAAGFSPAVEEKLVVELKIIVLIKPGTT